MRVGFATSDPTLFLVFIGAVVVLALLFGAWRASERSSASSPSSTSPLEAYNQGFREIERLMDDASAYCDVSNEAGLETQAAALAETFRGDLDALLRSTFPGGYTEDLRKAAEEQLLALANRSLADRHLAHVRAEVARSS